MDCELLRHNVNEASERQYWIGDRHTRAGNDIANTMKPEPTNIIPGAYTNTYDRTYDSGVADDG